VRNRAAAVALFLLVTAVTPSVDVEGSTATARIEHEGAFVTDFLSLPEIHGEWKIVNKIFHVEMKAEGSE